MSSSTRRRPLVDVMLDSITDLTRVSPHLHENARYTPSELRAYQEGYYAGVVRAMEAADQGAKRFKLRVKTLAAVTRQKKSA
jgi:hypothetical protein